MPHATFCAGGCGLLVPSTGRCPTCAREYAKRDNGRRNSHPRREVYGDARWPGTRQRTLRRDGYRCVKCGRHRDVLGSNECLHADHIGGWDEGDPFDVSRLQTLCSRCSGRKDGARSKQRVRQPSDEARREVRR